jgi:hypothetical protein
VDSPDIEKRTQSQLTYFDRRNYQFFNELERFFDGKIREKIGWANSPWEKVGYLNIIKCPTRLANGQGQWSKIPRKAQRIIMNNCEDYLVEQLNLYNPKIVVAYGVDVCRWFAEKFNVSYEEFEARTAELAGQNIGIVFVPQRQGPHSKPEVIWVQNKILKLLS